MMSVPGTLGCTMDAPADAAYAVLPVGVAMIRPDTRTTVQDHPRRRQVRCGNKKLGYH